MTAKAADYFRKRRIGKKRAAIREKCHTVHRPMSPANPSFWKNYRPALVAVLAMLAILLVWYRVEQNRKTREQLEKAHVLYESLNEFVYGIDYPFAPTDLADRRSFIIADLLGDFAHRANQFEADLRADLQSAIRLKLEPVALAQIAHAAGDLALAEKAARQVLENPEGRQPGNHIVLGDILYSAEKYPETEAEYLKAMELTDLNPIAHSANPNQRLARFYSDKKTIILALPNPGREIIAKDQTEWRIEKSLVFWRQYLGPIDDVFDQPPWARRGDRISYATASIRIANILRDSGRPAEARHYYVRAFRLYRPDEGGETNNTKITQQLIDALPDADAKPTKQ